MNNNRNWEETPMGLINWHIKPDYIANKKAEVEFMLAKEPIVSIHLAKDLAELIKMGVDVQVNAKLTITNKLREVNMDMEKFGYKNHNGDNAIEYDDITNATKIIDKEYSITVDQVSGKIHIASDLPGGESIIQGIISGYIAKEEGRTPPAGAHFDNTVPQEEGDLRRALFSGHIYFENLPVDLMGEPVTAEQIKDPQIIMDLSEQEKVEAKRSEKKQSERKQTKSKQETVLELPPLDALKTLTKGQLKPPRGSSRTQRNEWWGKLRDRYPDCFDTGGNWIGWVDWNDTGDTDSVMAIADTTVKATEKETQDGHNEERVPGLLRRAGDGNRMTNMADKNIRKGFILGVLIKGKGYSTLSTPTELGDEKSTALLVVNKPRTGKFMLAGLQRNSSFSKKVKGYDLVDIMTFHAKYFTEDSIVYFITNAVTALQELGTQEKDIADIKENSA